LQYHVLATSVEASAVPAGPNAPVASLDGENVFATRNTTGVFINGVKVKTADVAASNGIIHIVEKVLIPSGGLDIVGLAAANPNFSYLVAAVLRADASGTSISGALKAAGPLTVFAPVNQAFIAAGFPTIASIQAADPNTLKNILLYHVIAARVFSSDLAEGAKPATAGGGTVTITLAGGAKVKGNANPVASNIAITNVVAANGVVHAIDRVLLP
ncbi:MAG: fasciclin domain-containing protein, partial [Chitinophagaceae bacterium]